MNLGHVSGATRQSASFGWVSNLGPFAVAQRIWRALRRHGATPAPIHYIAVAAGGTILGATLNKAIGARWWLSPVLALAGAWALAVLPVWGRGSGTSLRTDLLIAVAPERGWERREREEHQRIRESKITMFEVADWPGWRSLSGWGTSGGRVTHVTLSFADDEEAPATLSTTTFDAEHYGEDDVQSALISELAGIAANAVIDATTHEVVREAHLNAAAGLHQSAWEQASIVIDGTELTASSMATDLGEATYVRVGEFWVATVSEGTAAISVRSVSDDSQYLSRLAPPGHTRG